MAEISKFYGGIRDSVFSIAEPFAEALDKITGFIANIVQTLGKTFGSFSKEIAGFFGSIVDTVEGFLRPIKNAMDDIFNAIKPIKWVFDTIECLEAAIHDAVDWILKETGI